MNQSDSIRVRGHIKITAVHDNGLELVVFDDHNLVVSQGLTVLTELLAQQAVGAQASTNNGIASLWVGGRTTGSNDTSASAAPSAAQTSLQGTAIGALGTPIKRTTLTASFPTATQISYSGTLSFTDAVGYDIMEIALYTQGTSTNPDTSAAASPAPRMVARQVVGTIPKTGSISLQFTWVISLVAS